AIAAGSGALGAATSDENATPQERLGRAVVGGVVGSMLGAKGRQIGRMGQDAARGFEDAVGVAGRRGATKYRTPPLTEAQKVEWAADRAADKRIFDAISALPPTVERELGGHFYQGMGRKGEASMRTALEELGVPYPEPKVTPSAGSMGILGGARGDNPAMIALDDVWEGRVQREVARVTTGVPPEQAGLVEKILAVTVNNLFTPGTVGINVVGNTVQAATRPLRELLEGRPGVAGADLLAMARQTPKAARRAGRLLAGGSDALKGEGDVAQTMMAGVGRPEAFPGRAGLVLTPIARANQSLDEFFRGINGAGAGAAAKAMNLPEDEAAAFVADAVATSVFQGPPSRMTKALTDWGSKTEGNPAANAFWKASVYSFFPFIRITEQLAGQAVKVLAAPVTEIGAMLQAGARRDPEAFRKGFAKWTMASALWGIALERADAGELTGVGTGSYQEDALARNARDAQGNPLYQKEATRIGGRWFPNDFAGPWGMAASNIASFVEGVKDNGKAGEPSPEAAERLVKGLNNVGRQLNKQFYLDDFVTFMDAVGSGRGVEAAGRMATDMSTRVVPGLIRPITEKVDPVVREPGNVGEAIASRIPGLSRSVSPKIDPSTGQPVIKTQDVLSTLFRSPAPGEPNPVAGEAARLERAGHPISVKQIPRNAEYAGEKQSPEQRRALQEGMGQATKLYVTEMMNRPA
ncbi:MAG TPA: hypothetical protein VNM48_15810, partial [Chloroflexota bacterium]|nr:hypothetical protein [Chloroflexota bacterium]